MSSYEPWLAAGALDPHPASVIETAAMRAKMLHRLCMPISPSCRGPGPKGVSRGTGSPLPLPHPGWRGMNGDRLLLPCNFHIPNELSHGPSRPNPESLPGAHDRTARIGTGPTPGGTPLRVGHIPGRLPGCSHRRPRRRQPSPASASRPSRAPEESTRRRRISVLS